jgi:hypothetical protein
MEKYGLRGPKEYSIKIHPTYRGGGYQTYSIKMLENEKIGGRTFV